MAKKQNNRKPKKGKRKQRPKQRKINVASIGSTIGEVLGQTGRGALRGLGLPFETSGLRAVATPSRALGPIQVSAPSANGLVTRTTSARMKSSKNGSITVCHREYLADIIPSTETVDGTFQVLVSHQVNPGNPLCFPWLSEIATRFESYKFSRLRFIYEPQCPTTSSGTVMMVVDYDADDDLPVSKTQMMAFKNATRSPPWFANANESDPMDLNKRSTYYVANGNQVAGDARLSNVGQFTLAFEGAAETSFYAGELYVEYEVTLMTPSYESYVPSGQAKTPLSPTNLSWGQLLDTLVYSGPNEPVIMFMSPNSLNVYPKIPGYYLVVIQFRTGAGFGISGSQFPVATPIGNSVISAQGSSFSVASTSGSTSVIMIAIVNFPNDTDGISIGYNTGTLSSDDVAQLGVFIAPYSPTTFPIPGTLSSNPMSLKVARLTANFEKSLSLRSASKEVPNEQSRLWTPQKALGKQTDPLCVTGLTSGVMPMAIPSASVDRHHGCGAHCKHDLTPEVAGVLRSGPANPPTPYMFSQTPWSIGKNNPEAKENA